MTELQIMLQQYREGERVFQSAEQNEQLARDAQAILDAAVPQVVADERAAFEAHEPGMHLARDKEGEYENPYVANAWLFWQARAALAAAPVQAQEPVADIKDPAFKEWCRSNGMWGVSAELKAFNEAVAIGRNRAPVRPVAVPDGWKLMPVRMAPEMKSILKEAAPKWSAESIYCNLLEAAPAATLKPCPFCGNVNAYLDGDHHRRGVGAVCCDECNVALSHISAFDEAAHTAAWNRRAAIAPPVAAGSVDTEEFRDLLGKHADTENPGEFVTYINAWGAQQRYSGVEAGRKEYADSFQYWRQRAEKAEVRVKELEAAS